MKQKKFNSTICWALAIFSAAAGNAMAQGAGTFVIPGIRAASGTQFAYWDLFAPAPSGPNYNYPNPPALLDGTGADDNNNLSNLFAPRAVLLQTGNPNCFVTSTGALYHFAETPVTAFEARYTAPAAPTSEVTNVIFQTQTGGSRFDLNNIKLEFIRNVSGTPQTISLPANFKALDDPQTGGFSERLVSAFQWNLTGQDVRDFKLLFSAPGGSMPLWQCQLDTVVGSPFVQQLGYLLIPNSLPVTRFGKAGSIDKNVPFGDEDRFFLPGQTLHLLADPTNGWSHVGWLYQSAITTGVELPVTFGTSDLTATAIFAPTSYPAWRTATFFHANSITGQGPDDTTDSISGPAVDHDGDGASNYAEFVFGGDPYVADSSRITPVAGRVNVGGTDYPSITFRKIATPADESEPIFRVRISTDLAEWRDNDSEPAPVTGEVSSALQSDGTALVTVRALQPFSANSRLYFSVIAE